MLVVTGNLIGSCPIFGNHGACITCKCGVNTHYHARKTINVVETTLDKALTDIKIKFAAVVKYKAQSTGWS